MAEQLNEQRSFFGRRRRRSRLAGLVAAAASLIACRVSGPVTPSESSDSDLTTQRLAPQVVSSVEGFTEYELTNGLRVLLIPDRSRDRVTVNVTYLVGSRHEGNGEAGMAHLLEHMLFKGTPEHPDPFGELNAHGADFNGTTWFDRTNYYETVTSDHLEWAIAFEADRMVNCPITNSDLSDEYSVVLNELEMGENDPEEVLSSRATSAAYLWHAYGNHPIGTRSDIEHVSADRLRQFYGTYYRPNNAVIVIAGDFDSDAVLGLVDKHFGEIEAGPTPPPTYTVEPVQDGERTVTVQRVGEVERVLVLYHGVAGAHRDFVAAEALVHLLTDNPSGRLYRELVKTGIASSVTGVAYPLHDPGWIEISASVPDGGSVAQVRAALLAALDHLTPPTEEELTRYKNGRGKEIQLGLADTVRTAENISDWIGLGDWRLLFVHRDRVASLEAGAVERFATEYLRPSNRTVGVFEVAPEPERAPATEAPDVAAMVDGYAGRQEVRRGERTEVSLAALEERTHRVQVGEVSVAMTPKRTRGGVVQLGIRLRAGSVDSLRGRAIEARFIAHMLKRGAGDRTTQQIRDEVDRLLAEIQVADTMTGPMIYVTTVREHVPSVVGLVGSMLRHPTISDDEFELMRSRLTTNWKDLSSDPRALASAHVSKQLRPHSADDPRATWSPQEWVEGLKTLNRESVRRVHSDLWGAGNLQIAAVGDFDEPDMLAAIEESFTGWASPVPYQRPPAGYSPLGKSSVDYIDTPDKQMAVVTMAANLAIRDDAPDYPALALGVHLLGGSEASLLTERLRKKEGWSYYTAATLEAEPGEAAATLKLVAWCSPADAEAVRVAMAEELERLVQGGRDETTVDAAKRTYRAAIRNQLANDKWVAYFAIADLEHGRTFRDKAEHVLKVEAVSLVQLRGILGRRLGGLNFATVVAADFSLMGPGPWNDAAPNAEPEHQTSLLRGHEGGEAR